VEKALHEEKGDILLFVKKAECPLFVRLLPRPRIEAVFRDLVAWDIDLFGSTRDATSG
jgi:hypothetical protein